ncbi:hypothetical protein VYU27_005570 [Nannochloropsis oceanica]
MPAVEIETTYACVLFLPGRRDVEWVRSSCSGKRKDQEESSSASIMRPPLFLVCLSYVALLGSQASWAWIAFFPGGQRGASAATSPSSSSPGLHRQSWGDVSASSSSRRRRCPSCGTRACASSSSSSSPFLPPSLSHALPSARGGGAFSARRRGRQTAAVTAAAAGEQPPSSSSSSPLHINTTGQAQSYSNDSSSGGRRNGPLLHSSSISSSLTKLSRGGKDTGNLSSFPPSPSSSSSGRRHLSNTKPSSTLFILAFGLFLTAAAAVIPSSLLVSPGLSSLSSSTSSSLLSFFLAKLRPPPGIEPTGRDLYWRIFLSGGVCASISHGWAVPLDVVKTRLQTDPERYQGLGIWGACEKIRREEGPGMLLKGLGATLTGYSIQGSLKYGLYAMLKTVMKRALPLSSVSVTWVLASMMADVIASTALCPLEATRIRLVADPGFAHGTLDGLANLIGKEGVSSIFKGMPAILAKQLPYTIVQLCGFELITRLFYSWEVTAALVHSPGPWQWAVSFGSAVITGIFASLASQPGDVILSRVNRDRSHKPVLETMKDAVRELGIKGLFKGTRARLLHVGMIVTIQLVIYDFVKQLVGLPATGAH